jgi:type I restriction enzyme S subunit
LFGVARTETRRNDGGLEKNVLSLSYGNIVTRDVESNHGLLPASFDTYQLVESGEIILRLTDLQNDKRSLRVGYAKAKGIITSAYLKLVANKDFLSDYFFYRLLHSYDTTKVFYGMGGGLRQSMKFEEMRRLPILLPPITEQTQIAAFLDYETVKIDALIDKQERLIALLEEKRQAVISHAVTKGLDPTVPLRPSGIDWLGEVPAHWEVKRLKFLAIDSAAGPYGSSLTKSMYSSTGIKVYGQQQVISNDLTEGDYYISSKKFQQMQRYEVQSGEILVSVMGTIGKVAVVPEKFERGIINPRLVKYYLDPSKILPEFVREIMLSDALQSKMRLEAQGSTMDGLNMAILGALPCAFPKIPEQQEILITISRENQKFEALLSSAQSAIALLKERRTALISAAVTGKIDLRDWRAPSTPDDTRQDTDL